ncbi:MAG: hypothetical protein JWO00_493 [Candidatus Parcubacteria bacterium]|nr:hypothetical protein [Candidatus Parcubacteria bacterium]
MNFKTRIKALERQGAQKKKEEEKLKKLEARSRAKWTKENRAFRDAARQLARLKTFGTKKHQTLRAKVDSNWDVRSVELTKERDALRARIVEVHEERVKLGTELATLKEQENGESKQTDEIVTQVFSLNDVAVQASKNREEYVTRQIFPRLLDDKNKPLSQVSFTSADGLRRVVAMTNTMTIVQGDMAREAQMLIGEFFERFQKTIEMDPSTKALYELTKELLIEKTSFKVGPDLYRFLGMDIDESVLPALAEAQRLLRLSIRSEKTNSYIRIYERKSMNDAWEPVRQV